MSRIHFCRLCVNVCESYKLLFDPQVYEVVVKYFEPKYLTPAKDRQPTILCQDCWHLVVDFNNFQQMIIKIQTQFEKTVYKPIKPISANHVNENYMNMELHTTNNDNNTNDIKNTPTSMNTDDIVEKAVNENITDSYAATIVKTEYMITCDMDFSSNVMLKENTLKNFVKEELQDNITSFKDEPLEKSLDNFYSNNEDFKNIVTDDEQENQISCFTCNSRANSIESKTIVKSTTCECEFCIKHCKYQHNLKTHVLAKHSQPMPQKATISRENDMAIPTCGDLKTEPHETSTTKENDMIPVKSIDSKTAAHKAAITKENSTILLTDVDFKSHLQKENYTASSTSSELKNDLVETKNLKPLITTNKIDLNRFKCTFCPKSFQFYDQLYRHKYYCHKIILDGPSMYLMSDKQNYTCDHCGKAFRQRNALLEHASLHTKTHLYKCFHCSVTFRYKNQAYAHLKNIHPQEWEKVKGNRRIPKFDKI